MENRSLTLLTRTQFSPTKSLLSTYLTCHSAAIYTYKVTCLPCMLFILAAARQLHIELYLLTSLISKWCCPSYIPLSTQIYNTYFRFCNNRVLADMGTRNDRKLCKSKCFFLINEIYLVADICWNMSLDGSRQRGWAKFPSNYFVNEFQWPRFLGRRRFPGIYGSSSVLYLQLSFKYFQNLCLIPNFSSKVWQEQTTILPLFSAPSSHLQHTCNATTANPAPVLKEYAFEVRPKYFPNKPSFRT